MKRYFFFAIIILIFSYTATSAQTQYTGCLYNGKLYYMANGTSGGYPNYKTNPNITLSNAFCVQTISGICRVNKKMNQQGTLRTFYMVQCPIDDYVPIFIVIIAAFGFITISNSNKINFSLKFL